MAISVQPSSLPRLAPRWLADPLVAAIPLASAVAFGHAGADPWLLLYALAIGAPLLVRRRFPIAVLAWVLVLVAIRPFGAAAAPAVLIAVYSVAASDSRTAIAITAVAIATAVSAASPAVHGNDGARLADRLILWFGAVGFALALGLYQATRVKYVDGLQERAGRLERERELLLEQAVAAERLRIARELHDVVAHNVSLMVVQAQALAAEAHHDRAGLDELADSGRQAMTEMHRMLGLLRIGEGEESATRVPQPGVDDLPALVERAGGTSLKVAVAVEGTPCPLSQAIDLTVYRIAQEALTNVVKHTGSVRAEITLHYLPAALELRIEDEGGEPAAPAPAPAPGGHGLLGLRERVALFGGTLEVGPRPDGSPGYLVLAVLPLGNDR